MKKQEVTTKNEKSEKKPVVEKKYSVYFGMLIICFVLWGLLNSMTDNLVPAFEKIFNMSSSEASLVQVAFYSAYAVLALPAALLIRRYSYRAGVLLGLGMYSIGALGYIPAAITQQPIIFMFSVFVLAGGLSILETTCNPFVYSIGDEENATRRLNMVQGFNPIGCVIGIILAKYMILANLHPAGVQERINMPAEQLHAIRNNELLWVCIPYLALIVVAVIVWIFFYCKKIDLKDDGKALNLKESFRKLFKRPLYRFGVITQFFYVGMQIGVWTFTIKYMIVVCGATEMQGSSIVLISMFCFIACRWICTMLMKKIQPAKIMSVMAILGILVALGTIFLPQPYSAICLPLISACMSLMFPTIYAIALKGLGEEVKIGAAGLVMAIVGGAVLTPIMGSLIDNGTLAFAVSAYPAQEAAMRSAFLIPVLCFAIVLAYALYAAKKNKKE